MSRKLYISKKYPEMIKSFQPSDFGLIFLLETQTHTPSIGKSLVSIAAFCMSLFWWWAVHRLFIHTLTLWSSKSRKWKAQFGGCIVFMETLIPFTMLLSPCTLALGSLHEEKHPWSHWKMMKHDIIWQGTAYFFWGHTSVKRAHVGNCQSSSWIWSSTSGVRYYQIQSFNV